MEIGLRIFGYIVFLLTLPVITELTLFLIGYLFLQARRESDASSDNSVVIQNIAVLIPAHNEESCIERCVASLLAAVSTNYTHDVIVIADNCQDQTALFARKAGAKVLERTDEIDCGKGAALNYAISRLENEQYDAYIIIDADSIVSPDFIEIMGRHFSQGKEALQCIYLALNVEDSAKIGLMNLSLLSVNVLRPYGRELLRCSAGILGNGFGLTKRLLQQIPYSANSITEDLEYHLKLLENGKRVRFVKEVRVLADFPVSSEGSETQRARWEGGRFQLQRKYFFKMLAELFTGKRNLAEPLLELMSLPLSYEVVLLLILLFLPNPLFFWYSISALAIIFIHIIVAVVLYGKLKDLFALAEIPRYILWKLIKLPKILLASKKILNGFEPDETKSRFIYLKPVVKEILWHLMLMW